ncbi:AMP-binding protein [Arcobacter porcinus]|uniref:AMP-binding protein n=1 Tax=Arcobacter porcinus TaxID=1935204 RepID=UPI000826AD2D|nr:AMP-binding protein [Arcobacter porcinus]OCL85619.1 Gramicidin S synthase 2 [Arcobacter porcinus]
MTNKENQNLDFLDNYLDNMLSSDNFFVADVENETTNKEFINIVDSLANEFIQKQNNRQLSIVVLLDRKVEYLASIFAAWKCNSYFVPLNTKWPKERIKTIITHCDADIVVCSKSGDYHEENSLYIEDIDFSNTKPYIKTTISKPSDLAYIIYTSGSTGIPKGVMITNESYLSYVKWTKRFFTDYKENKALLLTAELTFDITMGDIAFALAFETSIVISPDPKNIVSHIKLINKYSIDTLYSVPTTHSAIFSFVKRKKNINIDTLKLIMSGGDSFSLELIKQIKDVIPNSEFYNVYGPTEVTINCFATRVDDLIENIEKNKLVPIGKPFDTIDAVLIDENGNDVTDKKKVGRLFVNGTQVMLGYLDDEDKTVNSFILDPRYPKFKRKLYNTGDLAIKKEDGLFYLLGRSDDIVKIKGYRVNPTEINNVISKFQSIKETVVFPTKNNDTYKLINCVVVEKDFYIDSLKLHILKFLPEYMLPSEFIIIDSMPLNNSGKIDKKILKEKFEKGELK